MSPNFYFGTYECPRNAMDHRHTLQEVRARTLCGPRAEQEQLAFSDPVADRDNPSLHLITGGDAEGLIAKLDSDDAQVVLPADGGLDPTRRIIDKLLS